MVHQDNQLMVIFIAIARVRTLGSVSRKPWKHVGPAKPFSIYLSMKTERSTRPKLLVLTPVPGHCLVFLGKDNI